MVDWSLTSLQLKLIKIGARVVRHSRAITFQLTKVAVTAPLVRAIIAAIQRLRAPPASTSRQLPPSHPKENGLSYGFPGSSGRFEPLTGTPNMPGSGGGGSGNGGSLRAELELDRPRFFLGLERILGRRGPDDKHGGVERTFENDRHGLREMIAWLGDFDIARVVFEPTGRSHRGLEEALAVADVPACKVNPRQARRFAEATGKLAEDGSGGCAPPRPSGCPGISAVTAATLVLEMPELGTLDARQVASLAGLAPITRQSGTWQGRAFIRGGRAQIRRALYMPALVDARFNPDLKATFDRLTSAGKPPKIAITAVMRKLLILANALLWDERKWRPTAT